MATQQDVIKKFMASLDNTTLSGANAVSAAIKAATGKNITVDALIKRILEDREKAINSYDFLKNYCGINLEKNNIDTGAITGSDAGGSKTKTSTSVVPNGTFNNKFNKTSFTIPKYGVTFKLNSGNFYALTNEEKHIWQGLYSFWAEESLKLIEESYGYSFKNSDVKPTTIFVEFVDDSSDNRYTARTYPPLEYNGENYIVTRINMYYFKHIAQNDPDGKYPYWDDYYLDRLISHELTHAVMSVKTDAYTTLPNIIVEGTAELVSGMDDSQSTNIIKAVQSKDMLKKLLVLKETYNKVDGINNEDYVAGYIFLRYLAKQFSDSASVKSGLNYTNDLKNTLASGTSYNDTIKNIAGGITIKGGSGNDSIYSSTDKNYTVKSSYGYVTIDGGAGNDTIYSYDPHVSINGGIGQDLISVFSSGYGYVTVYGGDGKDSIRNNEKLSKIYGDADADYIVNTSYGKNVTVYGGAGADTISNTGNNSAIYGGADNDSIVNYGENVTIYGGTGNDKISLSSASKNNVIVYNSGDGNDTIQGISASDTIKITGGSYQKITLSSSSDVTLKVGNGSMLLKNAKNIGFKINGTSIKPSPNIIENYTTNTVVSGTKGKDTIKNYAGGVMIKGGDGNDSIYSSTKKPYTVKSAWGYVTIDGGNGNDTIYSNDPRVSINGGAGDDKISVGSYENVTVVGGKGNDTIYGNRSGYGVLYRYNSGDGNDVISSINANDTIKITGGSYQKITLSNSNDVTLKVGNGSMLLKNAKNIRFKISGTVDGGNKVSLTSGNNNYNSSVSNKIIYALAGNDKIKNTSSQVTIYGGTGKDSIENRVGKVLIYGDNDNDSILNTSSNVTIYGGAGNDTIENHSASKSATIHGDGGNDLIKNNGSNIRIFGDAGNDKISIGSSASNVTVIGGANNDTIYSSNSQGIMYKYAKGDGNDYIKGWTAKDTLTITGGAYKTSTTGSNVIVSITGGAKITLAGAKGKKININPKSSTSKLIDSDVSSLILFDDDNFVTDTAQIDSIKEISETNYSVGKVTSLQAYDIFSQDSLPVATSYDKK